MDNPKENTNILSKLKTPSVFYPLVAMIIFLIIMLCLIFFKVPINFSSTPKVKSQNEAVSDIFIILFFSLIVFLLCFILLPNFKELMSRSWENPSGQIGKSLVVVPPRNYGF